MQERNIGQGEQVEHRLGIMGGTFDPIHLGHLRIAESVRSKFRLDKVIFVPSYCPPHKSITDISPAEHRFAMVSLAINGNHFFEVSHIEMDRCCPTYAGETIEELKKMYGRGWEIYFITGLDALLTIINWEKSRTYPGVCQFIAAARPGYDKEEIGTQIPEAFVPYVTIVEEPLLEISSTEIRQRIKNGKPVDHMVPEAVKNYIYKWRLYLEGEGTSAAELQQSQSENS